MTARSSSIRLFSKIAREYFHSLSLLEAEINQLRSSPLSSSELNLIEEEAAKLAVISIVFSAIAVESYIYDYAARHLTDSFVQNYVDKLDLVSKWVIIPRLVTGKELPRTHKWLELLTELVRERNSIVHSKSTDITANLAAARKLFTKIKNWREDTFEKPKRAIQLLDLLINEMRKLDQEESVWIESYLGK